LYVVNMKCEKAEIFLFLKKVFLLRARESEKEGANLRVLEIYNS